MWNRPSMHWWGRDVAQSCRIDFYCIELLLICLLTGFAAGAVHVVGGADHLVAMTPFSLRQPVAALRSGLAWGAGHSIGVVVLGLAAIGLKVLSTSKRCPHGLNSLWVWLCWWWVAWRCVPLLGSSCIAMSTITTVLRSIGISICTSEAKATTGAMPMPLQALAFCMVWQVRVIFWP